MSKSPYQILLRPILTEKSNFAREGLNKATFEVAVDSNKIEIKKAVETLFSVRVTKVNVLNLRGKEKRVLRFTGRRPNTRRAIVTLAEGDSINLFGSAE
jgi:large subunit ribosomal protein L23